MSESFIERWLWFFALVLTVVLLAFSVAMLATLPAFAEEEGACETYRITGYVRGAHSPWTKDGTSVWTRERIAAASYNVPMGTYVQVIGLGSYRVADRGNLSGRHIDILVDTASQAYALTGYRMVCVYP